MYIVIRKNKKTGEKEILSKENTWNKLLKGDKSPVEPIEFLNKKTATKVVKENMDSLTEVSDLEDEVYIYLLKKTGDK